MIQREGVSEGCVLFSIDSAAPSSVTRRSMASSKPFPAGFASMQVRFLLSLYAYVYVWLSLTCAVCDPPQDACSAVRCASPMRRGCALSYRGCSLPLRMVRSLSAVGDCAVFAIATVPLTSAMLFFTVTDAVGRGPGAFPACHCVVAVNAVFDSFWRLGPLQCGEA